MALILDGKKVAESIYSKLLLEISLLPLVPKLTVILVGNNAASETYVRSKTKRCLDLGLRSETITLPENVTEEDLVQKIRQLNQDAETTGILVQLPLPAHIDRYRVLQELNPTKDVDGLHPENIGRLVSGNPRFVPCTPAGIVEMLRFYSIPMEGTKAVVIGRSEIVGKPVAELLTMNNATVTICHSKTQNLLEETVKADLLIVAMGRPQFIQANMVKQGATVVDVGIHRIGEKLVGDVNFEAVSQKAGAISPVPGGVGPLTIACLMKNLVTAASRAKR